LFYMFLFSGLEYLQAVVLSQHTVMWCVTCNWFALQVGIGIQFPRIHHTRVAYVLYAGPVEGVPGFQTVRCCVFLSRVLCENCFEWEKRFWPVYKGRMVFVFFQDRPVKNEAIAKLKKC
jgi:hypothetical protein